MNERKHSRQTTLFSFFQQPSKVKKDQTSARKPKKRPVKRVEKRDQPKTVETSANAASPTISDARELPVVSPIESESIEIDEPTVRGSNTRKRPRPKPSTVKNGPQDASSEFSSEQSKIKLGDPDPTAEDKAKGAKYDNQQQQQASAVAIPASNHQNEEDISSGDDSETEAEATYDEEGMSAYELLRLRNIERNNARLASLGLLNPIPLEPTAEPKKKEPRRARKTPNRMTKAPSIPTRRSTRSRRSVWDATETASTCLDNATEESQGQNGASVSQEEEETYTVSPLVQYAMVESSSSSSETTNGRNYGASGDLDCATTSIGNYTLYPRGPRLAPPKGLKAIYSLDFSAPFHSHYRTWLVGAGKAGIVALWDCSSSRDNYDWSFNIKAHGSNIEGEEEEKCVDPALTWKAHNGRWIADARFLPFSVSSSFSFSSHDHYPSRLVTAANDGKVCLWDLSSVSVRSGAPKLLSQSGADLHTSGIFAMDILHSSNDKTAGASNEVRIATGSKDNTVALSILDESSNDCCRPFWKSKNAHTAKVGAVRLHPTRNFLLASASDDDLVCIHDYNCGEQNGLVVALERAHHRPHSVVWDPHDAEMLMTAGLDKEIKIWDIRSTNEPIVSFQGHVPESNTTISRCKRIHHPAFYNPQRGKQREGAAFILSGGERSRALSMFQYNNLPTTKQESKAKEKSLQLQYSRGKLPVDCGDAGCIAVNDDKVAVSVQGGEVLILGPMHDKTSSRTVNLHETIIREPPSV